MSVVLMTNNPRKVAEYRRFLGRHAQTLLVERPAEAADVLKGWLATARAVLADESNLFDPAGDLVRPGYVGPARNICRLHAWVLDDARELVRRSFIREVPGHFDASLLRPDDPTVFNWDAAFTSAAGATLEELSDVGLKNSAREQCLSAFVKERLLLTERKQLKWTPADPSDWATDARLLLEHPLYQSLPTPLGNALRFVVHDGVFFRSAKSRREGNYWFPGLNGGLPYVPKSDPVHEATYLFHDVMHQLMPDLVFDGDASPEHRRTYLAYRMMSEAISLVLADMQWVAHLATRPEHAGYDFGKRRIFPLFSALPSGLREDLRALSWAMTQFVLLGRDDAFRPLASEWQPFSEKYTRFFVADFQWTRENWNNLVAREAMVRGWLQLVYPETFRAQNVWLLSDVVARVGRGGSLPELVERVFELAWNARIEPALHFTGTPDVEASTARGFRRWLTGQLAFFAQVAPVLGVPPLAHELAARVRDATPLGPDERDSIRARFRAHVEGLARQGIVSDDDAATYPHCFPLFDPFFLRDYDLASQEFATVAEASARAFG